MEIDNRYPQLEAFCRDYRTHQPPQLTISVSEAEIDRENQTGQVLPRHYLESLAVYRKICDCLLERNTVLFHCSALMLDGVAYLFTAPSGTGKSTHTRLWRERFGSRVTMINDDKPLLRVEPSGVTVYGTPYGGKEGIHTNTSARVGGIVLLHQAPVNSIRPLSAKESYPFLLNQTHRPEDVSKLLRTMELVQSLANLPVFELGCTISQEAVELAYNALRSRL